MNIIGPDELVFGVERKTTAALLEDYCSAIFFEDFIKLGAYMLGILLVFVTYVHTYERFIWALIEGCSTGFKLRYSDGRVVWVAEVEKLANIV